MTRRDLCILVLGLVALLAVRAALGPVSPVLATLELPADPYQAQRDDRKLERAAVRREFEMYVRAACAQVLAADSEAAGRDTSLVRSAESCRRRSRP